MYCSLHRSIYHSNSFGMWAENSQLVAKQKYVRSPKRLKQIQQVPVMHAVPDYLSHQAGECINKYGSTDHKAVTKGGSGGSPISTGSRFDSIMVRVG